MLHPTSLPGRPAGSRGLPLRRLARTPPARAGGRCCRSGRPTSCARRTRRRRPSPRGAASSRSRRRASRSASVDAFRRANAYWARDWERAGEDLADQVRFEREWSALREYARERGIGLIGDVPIYVAQGSVDQRTHPDALPGRARRRSAAGRARAARPALGEPALRLGRRRRRGLPLVDRAAPPHVLALRRRPDRPLPRLRAVLGDPGGREGRPHAGPGCRARAPPSSGPRRPSSARCR